MKHSLAVLVVSLLCPPLISQSTQAPPLFQDLQTEQIQEDLAETLALASGDFDRDGDVDLLRVGRTAVGTVHPALAQILWNDGAGGFFRSTALPLPRAFDFGSALATDLDGDGDLDLLIGALDRLPILQLRNDGKGHFTDQTKKYMPPQVTRARAMRLVDLDKDGDLDIIHVGHAVAAWLANDGKGKFTQAGAFAFTGSVGQVGIEVADFDADKDLDVLLSAAGTRPVLSLNDGRGKFLPSTRFPFPAIARNQSGPMLAGDFDNDGDQDLLLCSRGHAPRYFENRGKLSFVDTTTQKIPTSIVCGENAWLFDVDHDGQTDALLLDANGENVLLLGRAKGDFVRAAPAKLPFSCGGTTAVIEARLDADQVPDLAIAALRNRIWLARGDGSFVDANTPYLRPRGPKKSYKNEAIAVADLNADGHPDLIFDGIRYGDGVGGLIVPLPSSLPRGALEGSHVSVADFEGNGRLDMLVHASNWVSNHIVRQISKGYFDTCRPCVPTELRYVPLREGDLDGDGDVDLLAMTHEKPSVYLNNGRGYFLRASRSLPSVTGYAATSSSFFDADGDGDLDILQFRFNLPPKPIYQAPQLWLGDGKGNFSLAPKGSLPSGRTPPGLARNLDLDGDGNKDIWLCRDSVHGLWLGDGKGHFVDATARLLPTSPKHTQAVAFGDFDLDGDIDVVFCRPMYQDLYYEQDARGVFRPAPSPFPPNANGSLQAVPVDIDGDGDLDLLRSVRGNGDVSRSFLWINRLRHTGFRRIPVTGAPLELELWLDPGRLTQASPVLPLVSTRLLPSPIPIPPFGLLALDPAQIFDLRVQTIPKTVGRLLLRLPVPRAAALKGRSLHMQTIFFDRRRSGQLRLGNLISTQILH